MFDALLATPGLQRAGPATAQQLDDIAAAIGGPLPKPYRDLLLATDGLTLLDGHLRLLGAIDLLRWNDPDTWKYAWSQPPIDFICFGGTSIGDQWAWRLADISTGADAPVMRLDGFELTEAQLAPTTMAFLTDLLPSLATTQVDDIVGLAHERFGSLAKGTLLIAAPPAQFGVERLVNRMSAMSDRNVMTALGDIARQLEEHPSQPVTRFDALIDDRGRARIKLIFD